MYFDMSAIFMWPIVYVNIQRSTLKTLFNYFFVVLFLAYYWFTLQAFGHVVPYEVNPLVLKLLEFSI